MKRKETLMRHGRSFFHACVLPKFRWLVFNCLRRFFWNVWFGLFSHSNAEMFIFGDYLHVAWWKWRLVIAEESRVLILYIWIVQMLKTATMTLRMWCMIVQDKHIRHYIKPSIYYTWPEINPQCDYLYIRTGRHNPGSLQTSPARRSLAGESDRWNEK